MIFKGIDRRAVVGFIGGETAFNGTNCTGVIIEDGSYSSDYILGILNSKLCSHYLNAACPPKLSNTFRYNTNNINRIPIIEKGNPEVQGLVRQIVALKEDLDAQSDRFRSLIVSEYDLVGWPQKFTRWWDFGFKEFVRAGKIKITLVEKDELLTFWSGYQNACSELDNKITAIDGQIDSLVYEIYGLNASEIQVVESSIGKNAEES